MKNKDHLPFFHRFPLLKKNGTLLYLYLPRRPSYDVRLRVQPDHLGVRQRGLLHCLLPLLLEGQQREEQRSNGARLQAAMSTHDQRVTGYFILNTLYRHNLKKMFSLNKSFDGAQFLIRFTYSNQTQNCHCQLQEERKLFTVQATN